MTFATFIHEICVRGGIDTTAGFYTDSMLEAEPNLAYKWASAYKKWPFTEYMDKSGVFASATEENAYPNTGFKTDSIRMLKIGDDLFQKVVFIDYLKFRENHSSNTDKIFSDYGRILYVNPNCDSGTMYAYGQLTPTDMSAATDTTVFSGYDDEGDEAIIERTLYQLFKRAKKMSEAQECDLRARQTLEELWKRILDEQHAYAPKESGMWERLDIVDGEYYEDQNNPLQF